MCVCVCVCWVRLTRFLNISALLGPCCVCVRERECVCVCRLTYKYIHVPLLVAAPYELLEVIAQSQDIVHVLEDLY